MPSALTYPGVYVEEIPSGVRTITGVATSIAAFVGRAPRGPVDEAITITSYADYERIFGGLHLDSTMSYAVRDFYLNGGSEAVIVRIYKLPEAPEAEEGEEAPAAPTEKSIMKIGAFELEARYPGTWGNRLRGTIEKAGSLFNLTVTDGPDGRIEKFVGLTLGDTPRRVERVLEAESKLVRWKGPDITGDISGIAIPEGADDATKLEDPKTGTIAAKQKDLSDKQAALAALPDDATQAQIDAATAAVEAAEGALETEKGKLAALNSTVADSAILDKLAYFPDQGEDQKKGLFALVKTDLFNLLCIPADERGKDTSSAIYQDALAYCVKRRAMLIVDPPAAWSSDPQALVSNAAAKFAELGLSGTDARNAAVYFPHVYESDPLRDGQIATFVPCGIIAGVMARTDVARGVWKAPAGLDAGLTGTQGLTVKLTDLENGKLNPVGINCLRSFVPAGRVVWGARTMRGADLFADEYKYIPIRRLALFIEESLYRGTQWVVFEPNDEPLWAMIRLNLGAFMHNLFRQGAFQGKSPREAYFVKCDRETTTQNDINLGIVNIIVGFAPLKPAEFVVIKITQIAGQIQT